MQMPMPKDPALHPALHRYVDAHWRVMRATSDGVRDAAERDLDAAAAELRAGGYYDEGGA